LEAVVEDFDESRLAAGFDALAGFNALAGFDATASAFDVLAGFGATAGVGGFDPLAGGFDATAGGVASNDAPEADGLHTGFATLELSLVQADCSDDNASEGLSAFSKWSRRARSAKSESSSPNFFGFKRCRSLKDIGI